MALADAGLVLRYALKETGFATQVDDYGPYSAHLITNNVGTGLALAGTSPHKRVDCTVTNQAVRLCRYLADSGDAVRTAVEGVQQVRIVYRGRWGTVPDYRTLFALNNWGTQNGGYGWAAFGLFHESNKLFCKWLGDFPPYNSITRPTDGATVDHTYEFQIDSTQGSGRMQAYLDGVLVFSTNTAVALDSAIALPADMQIALFNAENDTYGWRAFSPLAGISYLAVHVGQPQSTTLAAETHAALELDDDVFSAPPDVDPPVPSGLTATPTSSSLVDAFFATNEDGTGYFLVSNNATEVRITVEAAAQSAAASASTGCTLPGLTWTSGQYLHAVQKDSAGTPNWSSVLSILIADAAAPVATGPLVISNVTSTGCRVGGFSATDNLAVTGWRQRLDAGSWVEFGDVGSTYFDLTGLTTDATVVVDVQARDAAGNWSNTLSKTFVVGQASITINYLRFSWYNVQRLRQANPPPLPGFTLIRWERVRSGSAMNTYMGGMGISLASNLFGGGVNCVMSVTQGHTTGGFDPISGQRSPNAVDAGPPFYYEVAGMKPASDVGVDHYASVGSLVQPGETQASYPVVFDEWRCRVTRGHVVGADLVVEDYPDWVLKHIIRNSVASSTLTGAATATFMGTVPWDTEYLNADVTGVRIASAYWDDATIDAAVYDFDPTTSYPNLHFANMNPTITEITTGVFGMADLKGASPNHFLQNGGVLPTEGTEEFALPTPPASRRRIILI